MRMRLLTNFYSAINNPLINLVGLDRYYNMGDRGFLHKKMLDIFLKNMFNSSIIRIRTN